MLKRWFCSTKEKQEAERKRVEAQGIADYQKIIYWFDNKQLQYETKGKKELAASPNTKKLFHGWCDVQ
jgi:hypothetical protein